MQEELAKLKLIRRIELPANLFDHASPRELERLPAARNGRGPA